MGSKVGHSSFRNFSEGKYSYQDYLKVKDWFIKPRNDKETEKVLFNHFQKLSNPSQGSKHHHLFARIQNRILLEENGRLLKKNWWFYYRQIAALLIPVFCIAGLSYFFMKADYPDVQSWVEINAPIGAKTEFLLPDSTSGWLNNGAKLKYPTVYSKHRKVQLIGEAFFHVKHKEGADFTVQVADMDIKVLGTKFNVFAYKEEFQTKVVLAEGKVEVNGKENSFNHTLQPGEMLTFNHHTKSLVSSKVDPATYTAWTKGYLVINNEPMGDAARKIGRWFNADIDIEGELLKRLRLKATFKEESLGEVLNFIAMTTPISYEVEKGNYNTNGILNKTHVTIKMK
jgi:ferric-dicitrate binding protein FerR (iron transport regulator)